MLLIIIIDVKVHSKGVTSSILEQTSLGVRLLINVNEWWIIEKIGRGENLTSIHGHYYSNLSITIITP